MTQYLLTFVTLAKAKSFVGAARILHMTQPGVSQHLKYLENYYGTRLADRKGKAFQLTEAGKKLRIYAERLLSEQEKFKQEMALDEPHSGICTIAAPGSFGFMLYSFFLTMNRKLPGLRFHFTVAPNQSVVEGVVNEKFQLGFMSTDTSEPTITKSKIAEERLLLVVHKEAKVKSYKDLMEVGFVAHPDGYHYAARLLAKNFPDEFRSIEEMNVKGFINQANRILDPVAEGIGFTVLPEYAVEAYHRQKDIRVIRLARDVVDSIFVISKRHPRLPARYDLILRELRRHLAE